LGRDREQRRQIVGNERQGDGWRADERGETREDIIDEREGKHCGETDGEDEWEIGRDRERQSAKKYIRKRKLSPAQNKESVLTEIERDPTKKGRRRRSND
jgi:hypothetical protein